MLVTFVAIFFVLLEIASGERENTWLLHSKDGLTRGSLADVILQRPFLRRAERSAGRFKRWWWCSQDPQLPGCDRKMKQKNGSRGINLKQSKSQLLD